MERFGMLITLVAAAAALAVQANTAVYYRFEDDGWLYGDSSGNGHELSQVTANEVVQTALPDNFPSVIPQSGATNGYSASFAEGQSRALQADIFTDFSPEFTVEAYVQPGSVADGLGVIAAQWDHTSSRSWRLLLNYSTGRLTFQFSPDGTDIRTATLDVSFISSNGYYVAASVETNVTHSFVTLYCDDGNGLSNSYTMLAGQAYDGDVSLTIGANFDEGEVAANSQFCGNIDELRLTSRALGRGQLLADAGCVFYVDPVAGDDGGANDGLSLGASFKTITKARDAVRTVLSSNPTNDVTVWLRGGTYTLDEPIIFGTNDSAGTVRTVTYQAWANEEPVFCSDMGLSGWTKLFRNPLLAKGFPSNAIGQVFYASVDDVVAARNSLISNSQTILPHSRITELYDTGSGTKVPQSSTKGFEPETAFGTPDYLGGQRFNVLAYPEGILTNNADITDAELHIVASQDWTMQILPLSANISVSNRLVETTINTLYGLDSNKKRWLWPCAWIKNVPWGLTPGSWFFSGSEKRIYYWSPDGNAPAENRFVASNGMLEYFRIGDTSRPVFGLVFKGLTFTRGSRTTWVGDYRATRWRSAWAGYDEANALLRFRGAESCRVADCRFINSAATGVRLDLHCQDIRITGCEFGHLGESGVILSGYGPGYADVNFGNMIENNWFHHGGESYWHSPGIFVCQSGNNYIARNLIHDYGYNGIIISGLTTFRRGSRGISQGLINWDLPALAEVDYLEYPDNVPYMYASNNIVTGNEIFRVMDGNMGDGNAIYLHGAPFGNVVSYNYCHDIRGNCAAALRTDYYQWGVLFSHNVICRSTGEGIVLKGENSAINNYIINQQDGFTLDGTNTSYLAVRLGPNTNTVVRNNLYVQMSGSQTPDFYDFKTMDPNKPVQTDIMSVDSNLFWRAGDSNYVSEYISELQQEYPGFDVAGLNADPMFTDWENGDFRLQAGSPALGIGVESLDVTECGLLEPFRSEVCLPPEGRVSISLESHEFNGPTNVTISAPTGATVRYTLDGSEPDTSSPVYTSSFMVTNPVTVRAKMFGTGFVDRLDAKLILYPWTQPIYEPFELEWDNVSRSRMSVIDTDAVTLAVAPGAGHGEALCFNAGGSSSLSTCSFYELVHPYGCVEVKFDMYLAATNLKFKVQWRDAVQTGDSSFNNIGPNLIVAEGGELQYNNGIVLTNSLPLNAWFNVVMEADLSSVDPDFTLRITPEGDSEQVYSGLSFLHGDFMDLEYLTFLLRGSDSVYIDNMSIKKL